MYTTGPLLKVLRVLTTEPAEVYGLEILRMTGLKSGVLYPILGRLVEHGWVTRRWEQIDPSAEGRPRRRFYSLTQHGRQEARRLLTDHGITIQ